MESTGCSCLGNARNFIVFRFLCCCRVQPSHLVCCYDTPYTKICFGILTLHLSILVFRAMICCYWDFPKNRRGGSISLALSARLHHLIAGQLSLKHLIKLCLQLESGSWFVLVTRDNMLSRPPRGSSSITHFAITLSSLWLLSLCHHFPWKVKKVKAPLLLQSEGVRRGVAIETPSSFQEELWGGCITARELNYLSRSGTHCTPPTLLIYYNKHYGCT